MKGRFPRVFGEAYPVSCPRYRCPVHRARTAAGSRDAGEGVDRRPGVDVYREPVHADVEVSSPVTRCGPCVPDRVLASGFSGRGLIGRVHVRAGDRAVRAGQQNRGGESVVRWDSIRRPDQREVRCPRVLGEAYPVSCPRYRCPVHRAWSAAGNRDLRERVDCSPRVDGDLQPIHPDAELSVSGARWNPPVPDRVLTSRFTDFRGRAPVRPDERTACREDHDCVGEVVVRWAPTVPPAGIRSARSNICSAPNDHFTAGPHCRVKISARGRIDSAGGYPTIGARIVSPAGVSIVAVFSAPNDHFTTGPDGGVNLSGRGCVSDAGG